MKPNWPATIPGIPLALQQALQQIRTILAGGATLADNLFAPLIDLPFVHGDPITRTSPLRGGSLPVGFSVVAAWSEDGTAIAHPVPKFRIASPTQYEITFYALVITAGAYVEPAADYSGTVRGILWGG